MLFQNPTTTAVLAMTALFTGAGANAVGGRPSWSVNTTMTVWPTGTGTGCGHPANSTATTSSITTKILAARSWFVNTTTTTVLGTGTGCGHPANTTTTTSALPISTNCTSPVNTTTTATALPTRINCTSPIDIPTMTIGARSWSINTTTTLLGTGTGCSPSVNSTFTTTTMALPASTNCSSSVNTTTTALPTSTGCGSPVNTTTTVFTISSSLPASVTTTSLSTTTGCPGNMTTSTIPVSPTDVRRVSEIEPSTKFKNPFTATGNMQFTCKVKDVSDMRPKSAGYGVCEQALQVLLQSNGYFDCSEWTDGQQQYRWGKVWSWSNGCSVWVMATGGKDQTTRIGNGDIYAWIKKTMDEHREGDWIGARGNMDCGGNSIKWEINSVQ